MALFSLTSIALLKKWLSFATLCPPFPETMLKIRAQAAQMRFARDVTVNNPLRFGALARRPGPARQEEIQSALMEGGR